VLEPVVYVLTALAALVVVLTRLRLGGAAGGGGRHVVPRRLLTVHLLAGILALVVWTVFLVSPDDSAPGSALVGVVALGFWWVVAGAGLLLLARWLPSKGRHAGEGTSDAWAGGPWLSLLAHLGMAAGVVVFTYAYVSSAV